MDRINKIKECTNKIRECLPYYSPIISTLLSMVDDEAEKLYQEKEDDTKR